MVCLVLLKQGYKLALINTQKIHLSHSKQDCIAIILLLQTFFFSLMALSPVVLLTSLLLGFYQASFYWTSGRKMAQRRKPETQENISTS